MTHRELIPVCLGIPLDGLAMIHQVADGIRKMTVYRDGRGNLVFGFGGTLANPVDIGLDLLAFPLSWGRFQAHAGAVAEASSLLPDVLDRVTVSMPGKVAVAGYSQGGSHAVLIGLAIKEAFPTVDVEVVTFGALPALGFFSAKANVKVTNYRRRDDPMTWAPWWVIGLTFSGRSVKIGPKGWPKLTGHDPWAYDDAMKKEAQI